MSSLATVYQFGSFNLSPGSRLLLRDGQPVHIGARALDILLALIERPGEFVSKEALVKSVWPDTCVEATSLRVHVALLRKALGTSGARFIVNVPGKGYAFIGELTEESKTSLALSHVSRGLRTALPVRLTRMIGRSAAVQQITSMLLTKRFVTITGEGGVGKTTLSLFISKAAADDYSDGVAFVDLTAIDHPQELVSAFGRAVGVALPKLAPTRALCDVLRGQALLMVVDNCEHVIEGVAALVSDLLSNCAALRVLATSREPLRVDGEYVHRLESLSCPPAQAGLSASDAQCYEAVQLLVERVAASTNGYFLSDADAEHAAELCRRLDGVPLAIELAAARVGFFGLHGLLMRLPDRFRLLTAGDRTVMPRHQTLRALYDWSYDLLEDDGKTAFARLSVFAGFFSLDFALAMMPWPDRAKALNIFLDLTSKSLVTADLGGEGRRYRLLDSARVYAGEKLAASGQQSACRLLHANYLVQTLEAANPTWQRETQKIWMRKYGQLAEDVAVAVRWLSGEPDKPVEFGRITMASFQLAQHLSQLDSLRPFMLQALKQLEGLSDPPAELLLQLTTTAGLALSLGCQSEVLAEDWMTVGMQQLERHPTDASLLYTICVYCVAQGDFHQLLRMGERFEAARELAGDHQGVRIARRFQAQARHYLGDLNLARRMGSELLVCPVSTLRSGRLLDPVDQQISIGILSARADWLEGRTAEAEAGVARCIELAGHELDHAKKMVLALAAIPIALWQEDSDAARTWLDEFRFLNNRHPGIDFWGEWAATYEEFLSSGRVLTQLGSNQLLDHVGTICPSFHSERLIARAESDAAGWCAPEVFRAHGERLLLAAQPNINQALERFERALRLAREREMARWELRTAMSLVRLEQNHGIRCESERAVVASLSKFPAGADDVDTRRARNLLAGTWQHDAAVDNVGGSPRRKASAQVRS